jgi:hypothetical protein
MGLMEKIQIENAQIKVIFAYNNICEFLFVSNCYDCILIS